ncbi:hypothetical protein B6N60_01674 [Richelia sinica FACHB-800]|uniref:Uncharacterized protein n=1 Tax=Richelia sinica FACHB-800 TaxID=1357546 RepID=A0A975T680_9NOST|nr:hypothetical protein B6N60_01674 [Richelia sinica FACHB-800]
MNIGLTFRHYRQLNSWTFTTNLNKNFPNLWLGASIKRRCHQKYPKKLSALILDPVI